MTENALSLISIGSPAWKAAVAFHGHACPGLALGCRMVLAALDALKLDISFLADETPSVSRILSPDEELVCVTECDSCAVDAVQSLLGCTLGKGNLLLKLRGKSAMTFYYRPEQKAVRVFWQGAAEIFDGRVMSRDEKMKYFLEGPAEKLYSVRSVPFDPPSSASIMPSVDCSVCGEKTAESFIRLSGGRPVCLDCWHDPSRIL